MHKKGVSDVVSTVLIILLVVAAVAIIGGIVLRTVTNSSDKIEATASSVRLSIPDQATVTGSPGNQNVRVLVKREAGAGALGGINMVFTDNTGKTAVLTDNTPVNELETKAITKTVSGLQTIVSVSIAPIITLGSGKQVVSGNSDSNTVDTSGSPPSFDFSLSNGGSKTVNQGSSTTNTITATLSSGTTQSVSYSASGLPSGVTASFSPTSCTPTCTTTITLTASSGATIGTSTVTITGTGGSLTRTTPFSLTVNAVSSFDFSLSNGGSKTVNQGSSTTNTITATLSSGTTQSVSYSASGLPSGVTASFSPTSCTPTCTTTITLTASSGATIGTSTVTITGTGGSLTRTTPFSLTVNAVSSYSYSLANTGATSISSTSGSTAINTITANYISGSVETVSFATSISPTGSGITPTVMTSCTPTCTSRLTLTSSSSAVPGTYTVTVTGTSTSGVVQSTPFTLTVTSSSSSAMALSFNGYSQYLDIPDGSAQPTAYTLSAWIRPSTTGSSAIIYRTDGTAPNIGGWSHSIRLNNGKFENYLYDNSLGGITVSGTTTVTPGNWYYVVATAQNGGSARLYVNGVEEGTALSVSNMWTGGNRYLVAATSGGYGYFTGSIDELKIYNTALTSFTISSEYNSGSGRVGQDTDVGLSAGWHLDTISGSTTPNYKTGSAMSATLANSPPLVTGKL